MRNTHGSGPFWPTIREHDMSTIMARNEQLCGKNVPDNDGNITELICPPTRSTRHASKVFLPGEVGFVLDPPWQVSNG